MIIVAAHGIVVIFLNAVKILLGGDDIIIYAFPPGYHIKIALIRQAHPIPYHLKMIVINDRDLCRFLGGLDGDHFDFRLRHNPLDRWQRRAAAPTEQ